ncbi:MAG: NADH-quinone oxidoreductase subunit NuoB [Nitrososphaerota archaeon]|jgi:NADH-quinone oxidoreductase subunit B|nr:NADH-quinone oxidoreductase subunit NuoB [Nitrososphaerota archaeon]MDG6927607.1 NADH-quinone oxidoreductase subunit NuoB [Nitrososphaerota archaeon]MDG6929930.1 NADH-quinone oxidoreductase subunit NuoB [Nitrososphaerota archaeon]MDG6931620.1 NADH-quinone oxidoreductase subunit NuoB [Nitrososphaerota archaeon]MDG6935963.1 NADH-quinone oxidoreductase subunit NuoB [Nitrososphaerota archaeon]
MDDQQGLAWFGSLEEIAKKSLDYLKKKDLLTKTVSWGVDYSLWPAHLMTSCCGAELAAASSPRFDLERLGFLPFGSPRQTNLILVEGTTTIKMARIVKRSWEQMPSPKWVIAMGACAMDGGIFFDSYNTIVVRDYLPVDVYVPGCPPRPEALAQGVLMLQEKIRRERQELIKTGGDK